MSLLDTASLILTPNGYKGGVTTGKLYSVKPTDASGDMDVTRNTTSTRVNSSELIESVAFNAPRLDYPPLGGCPSILVEPLRTNLVLYSEQFNQANWFKADTTVTANATTAPDGTSTADNVVPFATATFHSVRQFFSVTPSISHTFSVYAKANGYTKVSIADAATGGFAARFDLSAESVISAIAGTTPTITNVGSGWYRLTATFTTTAFSTPSITGYPTGATLNNFGASFTGDVTSGVFLWGAQLEAGTNATSYIPTTISALARNADVISKTGVSSLIGQTEGTIYAEIRVNKLLGTASRYVFHLSDGTANNRIYMAFSGVSSNILRARIFNGGTLQCSIDSSTITATGTYKLALAYKNNDIVFYINGFQIGTATGTIPTCSRVDLGHNYAGASQLNDGINNANIWKTRLTNDQCEDLTKIT